MNVMLNKFLLKKKTLQPCVKIIFETWREKKNKPQLGEDGYGGREEAVV